MSITVEGTLILRAGKVIPEAIATLSTEQLKWFLVLHALTQYSEALEGTTDVQAAVRAELARRESTIWTAEALHIEKKRRLTEDLATLGPRPSWWRWRERRRYDRAVLHFQKAHENDLRTMLAAQDPKYREIVAQLIGWRL